MTAPIGSVHLDGRVTCSLCPWSTADRVDPVGALTTHRTADHPGNQAPPPATPEPTRHADGIALGAIIWSVSAALAGLAWIAGGWWIVAAVPCTLFAALGLFGLISDAQLAPRDSRGRRIR